MVSLASTVVAVTYYSLADKYVIDVDEPNGLTPKRERKPIGTIIELTAEQATHVVSFLTELLKSRSERLDDGTENRA